MKGLTWRIVTVVFTLVFSLYLLVPSVIKFASGRQIPKNVKSEDPWYYHVFPSEVLKLGLDLVGGLHLVLGIDFEEVQRDAITKLKNELKELIEREKIGNVSVEATNNNRVVVRYTSDEQWKKIDSLIGKQMGQYIDFEGQTKDSATLKMSALYESEVRKRAVDQSLETLRNRIDEFGIAEPILQRQGDEKIMVQFPGVQEIGRLKEIISRTAKLSFQIERSGPEVPEGPPTVDQLKAWVDEFQKAKNIKPDPSQPITKYLRELNAYLQSKIPAGTEVLFHKQVNVNTREAEYIPYLLDREALVTGEDLQDAYYGYDPNTNQPIVHFQLTPVGADKFEKATGANVGKMMAIVLDNNVHSAPRIKQRIGGGRAIIEMGSTGKSQQEIQNDAKDTSLVLRSGALPARLEFLEERVIGPSLGADAIRSGTRSLVFGLFAVLIFMAIYYRKSGVIAVGALGLNGIFILAAMAAFEGTLTLPGLAGITLTLGMAVDANVLIFEHMREELRKGKAPNTAIAEGYSRAFSAIMDSNLTTIIAGIVLISFGYGPIRGFAVTMLIGLTASLFTAIFVTRVIFDLTIVNRNKQTISI
ncbi:MAG: protein translocase subunit SecD [Deltaproteobacteria bacterium]|nr:protein translocase subunit SecD [Deltaproteobacteria bacterium]